MLHYHVEDICIYYWVHLQRRLTDLIPELLTSLLACPV